MLDLSYLLINIELTSDIQRGYKQLGQAWIDGLFFSLVFLRQPSEALQDGLCVDGLCVDGLHCVFLKYSVSKFMAAA